MPTLNPQNDNSTMQKVAILKQELARRKAMEAQGQQQRMGGALQDIGGLFLQQGGQTPPARAKTGESSLDELLKLGKAQMEMDIKERKEARDQAKFEAEMAAKKATSIEGQEASEDFNKRLGKPTPTEAFSTQDMFVEPKQDTSQFDVNTQTSVEPEMDLQRRPTPDKAVPSSVLSDKQKKLDELTDVPNEYTSLDILNKSNDPVLRDIAGYAISEAKRKRGDVTETQKNLDLYEKLKRLDASIEIDKQVVGQESKVAAEKERQFYRVVRSTDLLADLLVALYSKGMKNLKALDIDLKPGEGLEGRAFGMAMKLMSEAGYNEFVRTYNGILTEITTAAARMSIPLRGGDLIEEWKLTFPEPGGGNPLEDITALTYTAQNAFDNFLISNRDALELNSLSKMTKQSNEFKDLFETILSEKFKDAKILINPEEKNKQLYNDIQNLTEEDIASLFSGIKKEK